MNFNIVNNKIGELDRNRKYISVITAGNAVRDLVSNIEGKNYSYTHVPVKVEVGSELETYNIFLLYETDIDVQHVKNEEEYNELLEEKYNEMLKAVEEKFATHNSDAFLEPSDKYIQLGICKDTGKEFYKYKICFDQTEDPVNENQFVSFIVDPKYSYINSAMNRWYKFDEKLDIHKSDDIYQFIYYLSHKEEKKESFVKKLFKK